jgi:hypothetical protein
MKASLVALMESQQAGSPVASAVYPTREKNICESPCYIDVPVTSEPVQVGVEHNLIEQLDGGQCRAGHPIAEE